MTAFRSKICCKGSITTQKCSQPINIPIRICTTHFKLCNKHKPDITHALINKYRHIKTHSLNQIQYAWTCLGERCAGSQSICPVQASVMTSNPSSSTPSPLGFTMADRPHTHFLLSAFTWRKKLLYTYCQHIAMQIIPSSASHLEHF